MKVTTDGCLFGAWVAREIQKQFPSNALGLDIGAGTGLLSLMVAQKTGCFIEAIEIDEAAAAQAKENCEESPWKERIQLIPQDVLQWSPGKSYDFIFANPPFYEREIRSGTEARNIAHHGEGLRLAALLSFIGKHLSEAGCFFLLLPAKREKELPNLLRGTGFLMQKKIWVQQTPDHKPFRLMIQGGRKKNDELTEETIVIKDENNHYTPAFTVLLKDYYLHL